LFGTGGHRGSFEFRRCSLRASLSGCR
jgi:hypothetical protein